MWCPLQYNRLVGTNHVSQRFQVLVSVSRAWQHVLLTPVANTKVTTTGIAVPQYQVLRPKVLFVLSLSLPPKPTENVGDTSLSLKQSQCRRQFHVSCCEIYKVGQLFSQFRSRCLTVLLSKGRLTRSATQATATSVLTLPTKKVALDTTISPNIQNSGEK